MTFWRGVSILKDPLTLTANQQLLWELKPRTVFDFGAYKGGSALWTADMLKMLGCKSRVISIDIDLSMLDPLARESPDVEFIEGDLFHVEKCFPADFLQVKERYLRFLTLKDLKKSIKSCLKFERSFLSRRKKKKEKLKPLLTLSTH